MNNKYEIKKISKCEQCDGTGLTPHPDWERYWEEVDHRNMSASDDIVWFRKNTQYSNAKDYGDLPNEDEYCGECEGQGKHVSFVSLVDALVDLGIMRGVEPQQQGG